MNQELIDYESPCPTFSIAFSPLGSSSLSSNPSSNKSTTSLSSSDPSNLKLAVGSFIESYSNNNVTIIGVQPQNYPHHLQSNYDSRYDDSTLIGETGSTNLQFQALAKAPHPYPPTSLSFSPTRLSESLQASSGNSSQMVRTREMLATSSDCIRLWDFAHGTIEDNEPNSTFLGADNRRQKSTGYQLVLRSKMANSKADYSAPLTSFSWSQLDPSLIVTSSIDTTCTVWDISSSSAITQLIAHDREVYDVCWSSASRDIFASVGADGSVRMFDLRSLDHSTILYEAQTNPTGGKNPGNGRSGSTSSGVPLSPATLPPASPLLRLKFNPVDPNYIAVSSAVGFEVQVLDVRAPGVPIIELRAHQAPVNGLAWSGDGNVLGTCGDDSQVLIWDLSSVPNNLGGGSTATPNRTTTTTTSASPSSMSTSPNTKLIKDPILGYTAPQEVNSITWSESFRDWIAIGLGKRIRCLKV
ncbi:WD40-repeat-containing domain protein [Phakopsora pachyrhizi]|uniref:WD40-repeat-containing domain protein n=1 Tax=Phakopsora pachyrhizi TaxID=170000 RepID=A0AAV0B314_PHAPC|nr:WD40-repeat-containing domain protein [Phakopsora pachyrhizi]KAI8448418.1 WD40-repeat-containing domain protein [Phakopsora pachyrhizi]CAH7672151.1 WD40-repeat-containing domain protein [Phakopsora pachyrhizi]CAH7676563.1 WD40-repeat-containing domain protein [Phakopsora pachyrhizi]